MIPKERHERLKDLLEGDYVRARDAISKAETLSDELQVDGITHLRDSMESIHLSLTARTDDLSKERIQRAKTCLQRGAIQSLQTVADREFLRSEELVEEDSILLGIARHDLLESCRDTRIPTHGEIRDQYAEIEKRLDRDGLQFERIPELIGVIEGCQKRIDCLPTKRHIYGTLGFRFAIILLVVVAIVLAVLGQLGG